MWIVRLRPTLGLLIALLADACSPRKTIATAQTLYMRFHLFFPYKDFNYTVRSLSTEKLEALLMDAGSFAVSAIRSFETT